MSKFKKFSILLFLLSFSINLVYGMQGDSADNPCLIDDNNVISITNFNPSSTTTNIQNTNKGLINLGNTCFMNATLQVLSNISPLTKFLLKQNVTNSVILSYIKLLRKLNTQRQNPINPIDFQNQNLGTLNKNRIQNQINSEINEETKNDKTAIENLYKAEKQNVIKKLSAQEQALRNVALTNLNYNQIHNLNKKINQQTQIQLAQKTEYQQHFANMQQIKSQIYAKYKNMLVQHYGTEETAQRMFNTSSQQDAAEFLGEILDNIIENTTINRSNLQLKTIKQDTCGTCERKTNPVGDTFSIFNLPIQNTTNLEHCLNRYMQTTEEIEKYCTSDQCHGQNKIHTRTTKIQETPKLLIIQLNRFSREINQTTGRETTIKITNPIKFPLQLNLKNYSVQSEGAEYDLIGFVCHNGETANSGHYISYAKDYKNQNWYLYNDSMVEQKTLNLIHYVETLGFLPTGQFKKNPWTGKDTNIDEGIDSTPYILFYQKKKSSSQESTPITTITETIIPTNINIQAQEKTKKLTEELLTLQRKKTHQKLLIEEEKAKRAQLLKKHMELLKLKETKSSTTSRTTKNFTPQETTSFWDKIKNWLFFNTDKTSQRRGRKRDPQESESSIQVPTPVKKCKKDTN